MGLTSEGEVPSLAAVSDAYDRVKCPENEQNEVDVIRDNDHVEEALLVEDSRLMNLSAELRLKIYGDILTPASSIVFESGTCRSNPQDSVRNHDAGCHCCRCVNDALKAIRLGPFDLCTACAFYGPLNRPSDIGNLPQLAVLRVSKQVFEESKSVFYGQRFEFIGQNAWLSLHHWLHAIGPRNRLLVKDLSINHPIFCNTPSSWFDSASSKSIATKSIATQPGTELSFRNNPFTVLPNLPRLQQLKLTYPTDNLLERMREDFWTGIHLHPAHSLFSINSNSLVLTVMKRRWAIDDLIETMRDRGMDVGEEQVREWEDGCWSRVEAMGWTIEGSGVTKGCEEAVEVDKVDEDLWADLEGVGDEREVAHW